MHLKFVVMGVSERMSYGISKISKSYGFAGIQTGNQEHGGVRRETGHGMHGDRSGERRYRTSAPF
jgi:hypothetical protein